MKIKVSLILVFALFPALIFAQDEQLTITTYYPSPFGNYRELRAQRVAIGDTYINTSNYIWGNQIDDDADLVVEGNVGIGTTTPNATLDVRVIDADRPTNLCIRRDYTASSGITACPAGYYMTLGSYGLSMVVPPDDGYIICCQACIDDNAPFGVCD